MVTKKMQPVVILQLKFKFVNTKHNLLLIAA